MKWGTGMTKPNPTPNPNPNPTPTPTPTPNPVGDLHDKGKAVGSIEVCEGIPNGGEGHIVRAGACKLEAWNTPEEEGYVRGRRIQQWLLEAPTCD